MSQDNININIEETNDIINIVSSEVTELIDINVGETVEEVTLNITEEIIQVNINKITGGGGNQTLAQTLVFGNQTDGTDIFLNNEDSLLLENTSSLKKGTYNFGGNGGISRVCSNNYEDMWQDGFRHVFDQSGFIRNSTNCFNIVPDVSFDVTLRFKIGSIWTLDDGTNYICTDATEGAAVWELYNVIPTNTSDLNNDSNFVSDASYVHTDNNFTTAEQTKLAGIEAGAEVNVNADWNATSGDAQILNKPTIPSAGVTSVGLTMPSAFTVTNSPITSSGDIAVTGAGLVSQYVRGDGTLANFPNSTGGGASVNYYLNGSVSQGTFGGATYYQMSKTPILGAGTNFIRTNGAGNGYIASFITDAGDPSFLNISGGNWNLEFYFQSSASGGSPQFYGEIYKVSATNVFTLVASGSTNPEGITNGTTVDQYYTSIPVPQTSLLITDRIAIRIYVITGGRTITLHTENGNLCEVLTTFSTGLTALNGLTQQVQYFAVETSGTDFNISSATDTHTFNLPTASATNRGALSSTDWNTFNNKGNKIIDISNFEDSGVWDIFQNKNISYFLGQYGGTASYFTLRSNSSLVTSGTSNDFTYNSILYSTTAAAGTLAYQRGSNIVMSTTNIYNFTYLRRFQINQVSSDTRFFIGLTNMYIVSNPTNIEPTSMTQCIGLAKLSTSNNLFLIYNDGTGTATSVDLGINYPANSLFFYDLLIRKNSSSSFSVTIRKTRITTGEIISTTNNISTNFPNISNASPAAWITNNATAALNSFRDFGCVIYNNSI
jgi:hypothetical protein